MSLGIITGSQSLGAFMPNLDSSMMDQNVITIVGTIETLNDSQYVKELQGAQFLTPFIREVEGIQGHTEGWKEYEVYASDNGSFADAETYEEKYFTWSFYRKSYVVKDHDFSLELLKKAYEEGRNLDRLVSDRMRAISNMYAKEYLPKVAYEVLFHVPAAGGKYTDNFGFLRDVEVSEHMLLPGRDTNRNHFFGVATAGAPSVEDIAAVTECLADYKDVSDAQIVALGSRRTLAMLKTTLEWEGSRDIFARTNQPTDEIAGVSFIKNDYMPYGFLLFIAGDAPHLITKLVSPKPELRGIALVKENGTFDKLQTIYDLTNTRFEIQAEGYHLTGRHYGAFLDILNASPAGTPGGEMDAAGYTALENHAQVLKSGWFRGLR